MFYSEILILLFFFFITIIIIITATISTIQTIIIIIAHIGKPLTSSSFFSYSKVKVTLFLILNNISNVSSSFIFSLGTLNTEVINVKFNSSSSGKILK